MRKHKTGSQGCNICKIEKDQNPTDSIPVPKAPSCVPGQGKNMGYLHSKAMDVHRVNRDQLRPLSQTTRFAKAGQKPLLQEVVAAAVHQLTADCSGSGCLGGLNPIAVKTAPCGGAGLALWVALVTLAL